MTKFLDKLTDFVSRFIARNKAEALVRFVCFCCVGVINTAVDTGIFSLLYYVVFGGSDNAVLHGIAFAAGYACGVVCSFILNKTFTFRDEGKASRQWLPFILVNLVALGVGEGGIYLLGIAGITGVLAKIITVPVTLIINFFGSRLLVFKQEKHTKDTEKEV